MADYSIVTKCKYEFKNASNPCIITQRREEKRREEKISVQLFRKNSVYIYKQCVLIEKYKTKGFYHGH